MRYPVSGLLLLNALSLLQTGCRTNCRCESPEWGDPSGRITEGPCFGIAVSEATLKNDAPSLRFYSPEWTERAVAMLREAGFRAASVPIDGPMECEVDSDVARLAASP